LKLIDNFLEKNAAINLRTINFSNASNLANLNFGTVDQSEILPDLKTIQRIYRLTDDDLEVAEKLCEAGLHSAIQVASLPKDEFVREYKGYFAADPSIGQQAAERFYQNALNKKANAVLTYTAILSHNAPAYSQAKFNNYQQATNKNFNNLPSYEDLFGNQNFCECEECRSILSPAAYFVDLMRLQDHNIKHEDSNYSLKTRRPDLWQIPLSCENTNTKISKLQLVNEILLQNLKHLTPSQNSHPFTYKDLSTIKYPFNLPFHLPLTQIRAYLNKAKTDLPTLWENLATAKKPSYYNDYLECLKISPQQFEIYSTPLTAAKTVAPLYGFDNKLSEQDLIHQLADIEVFLKQTGLKYSELQELLYQDLSDGEINNNLNKHFFINGEYDPKTNPAIDIKSDTDSKYGRLENLTLFRLDRMNRFVRLAQAMNWSFTDLDFALTSIAAAINNTIKNNPASKDKEVSPAIDNASLRYLARIATIQQQNPHFSILAVCALITAQLKETGKKKGQSFFDNIFNHPTLPHHPDWKQDSPSPFVWNVPHLLNKEDLFIELTAQQQNQQNDQKQAQAALGAALKISQDELMLVGNFLLDELKITTYQLPLNLRNLSMLYAYAQLPKLTGLSIKECLTATKLPGGLEGFSSPAQDSFFAPLIHFSKWVKTAKISVYQLQYLLTGQSDDKRIQNQILGIDALTNFLKSLKTAIDPTLFTKIKFTQNLNDVLTPAATQKITQAIDQALQKKKYIDKKGKVTSVPDESDMEAILKGIFSPAISATYISFLSEYFIKLMRDDKTLNLTDVTNFISTANVQYVYQSLTASIDPAANIIISAPTPIIDPTTHKVTSNPITDDQIIPILIKLFPCIVKKDKDNGSVTKLASSLKKLLESYKGEKLTLEVFSSSTASYFSPYFALAAVFLDKNSLDQNGIVTPLAKDSKDNHLQAVTSSMLFAAFVTQHNQEKVNESLQKTITYYYQLQQKTATDHLAALHPAR